MTADTATTAFPEPFSESAMPRFADFVDQIRNQLNVIVNQLPTVRFTHLTKAFNVFFDIH